VLANQRRSSDRSSALERRLAATAGARVGSNDPGESPGEGEIVRKALALLSERDREALILVAWHELSGARAARAAGCTRAAFAVRLHRARARLAAQLDSLESPVVAAVNSKSLEVR
jgi:RNA polymerase sigma-70 factor, ECF subfamily